MENYLVELYKQSGIITYEDKLKYEHPVYTEGLPASVGSMIKIIDDETGEEKIIPFEPKTLKLSTEVVAWEILE